MTDRRNLKKCEACTFYDPISEATGRCRIDPPRVIQALDHETDSCGQTVWPIVSNDEWCSKFEMMVTAEVGIM